MGSSRDEKLDALRQHLTEGQACCVQQELIVERRRTLRIDTERSEDILATMRACMQATRTALETLEQSYDRL